MHLDHYVLCLGDVRVVCQHTIRLWCRTVPVVPGRADNRENDLLVCHFGTTIMSRLSCHPRRGKAELRTNSFHRRGETNEDRWPRNMDSRHLELRLVVAGWSPTAHPLREKVKAGHGDAVRSRSITPSLVGTCTCISLRSSRSMRCCVVRPVSRFSFSSTETHRPSRYGTVLLDIDVVILPGRQKCTSAGRSVA
jgi:hypothetical protein